VRVERGSEDLACRPVEDGDDTCRAAGDAYGVRYSQACLMVWASISAFAPDVGFG
jgi:hypothetical protein